MNAGSDVVRPWTRTATVLVLAFSTSGCAWGKDSPSPEEVSPPEASVDAFEELSGATIPESADSLEVTTSLNDQNQAVYDVTFTLPTGEDAEQFCADNIGTPMSMSQEHVDVERERFDIEEDELMAPRECSSMKDGEKVNRSVILSLPDDGPVNVYARAEEYSR